MGDGEREGKEEMFEITRPGQPSKGVDSAPHNTHSVRVLDDSCMYMCMYWPAMEGSTAHVAVQWSPQLPDCSSASGSVLALPAPIIHTAKHTLCMRAKLCSCVGIQGT